MIRMPFWFIVFVFLFLFPMIKLQAGYMLPYPSFMPGHKLYKVSRILDTVKKYWYWGSIGQVKYHLMLSDKYLVEAKTLFEYQQYLLATEALQRSDVHFSQLPEYMERAKKEGKHVDRFVALIEKAATEHEEVLERLKGILPETFTWTPERATPTKLSIYELLFKSIVIRRTIAADTKTLQP